jgi:anti-anti-sigma factor
LSGPIVEGLNGERETGKVAAARIEIDRDEPGVAVVSLVGEHELYSVLEVERALDAAIHEGLALVIDLTRTAFLDSSVVAILLRAREEAHVGGTGFALVIDDSTGPSVRQLFEITGLATIFRVASSRAEALAL